ncbi:MULTISPECIES: ABC transporter permease [unclassified Chelatococcus]|uniref:ABC transporter permease n=1 Tax=unclassified Chelatococcus TaxID=2638111 RepID=UPI001BCB9972|nr:MULTISPECIES: ABC transporter permease [unclassified Chelatococcus]MBS7697333.1 ABC transporter permease [Chelatococcus sp. YT9]MBX3556370.1 ABC transporter permease [Chelatococcus sp.]
MTAWQKSYDFLQGDSRSAGFVRIMLSVIVVLLFWQLLTSTVVTNRLLLVPPAEVFAALFTETKSGAVWTNGAATGLALLISFPVAVLVGVAGGLMLASNRLVSLTAGPMLMALYSVPVVALAPLFIAWLGLGFASKFVLVTLVAVFPVLVTTEVGLRATDKGLIDAAKSFNANGWQIFTTVTLPYALPYVVSGIRVAWARALVGIVVAEFFGSFAGFGFAILAAGQTFDTATLLAYVILLGAMGVIGSLLFETIERRMAPWRHE